MQRIREIKVTIDTIPLAYILRLDDTNIFIKLTAERSILSEYNVETGIFSDITKDSPTLQDFLEYMRDKKKDI